MPSVVVSSPAALLAALKAATTGAVILLTPGRWDPVVISGIQTPGQVDIRSQDPAHPAILPALTINRSEGIHLSGLTLATELFNPPTNRSAPMPFKILNSQHITLDDISIHGTLDGNSQDDVNGLLVQDSIYVDIVHCEFQQLFNGLIEYRNMNLKISGNNFHDIRDDGIDNAGSSFVTISNNRFSDFYPVNPSVAGDHPDAIQFWTQNMKAPAHDIEITKNIYDRGRGSWIQGIFVTDQIGLPYQRVTITDNAISGGMTNGIMVSGCADLTIRGNTVRPYADMMSWIRVEKCTDADVSHNRAGTFLFKNNGRLTGSGNETFQPMSPAKNRPPRP